MLVKMAEGIYRLLVTFPKGMGNVNSYLFEGEKGYTILDTGWNAEEAIQLWERTISDGLTIEKVIVTHAHPDHIGLAGWFQQKYQVPVMIPHLSYDIMRNRREKLQNFAGDATQPYDYFVSQDGPVIYEKKRLEKLDADYFEPDELIDNHQEISIGHRKFESIWTPGHSSDHLCFFNHSDRILLIGDHVLQQVSPIIPVWGSGGGNPLKDYFASLDHIATFSTDLVLPGHGEPIGDLKKRIEEIQIQHGRRLEQILGILNDTSATAGQICRDIYKGKLPERQFASAFMATLARLIYLESVGKVVSETQEGKVIYKTA